MLVTKQWIKENYDKFTKEYFYDNMPPVNIKITKSERCWGIACCKIDCVNKKCFSFELKISNYYDVDEKYKINTLLHEMIHIYDYWTRQEYWCVDKRREAHGQFFEYHANRIGYKYGKITTHISDEEWKTRKDSKEIALKREEKQNTPYYIAFVFSNSGNRRLYKVGKAQMAKLRMIVDRPECVKAELIKTLNPELILKKNFIATSYGCADEFYEEIKNSAIEITNLK